MKIRDFKNTIYSELATIAKALANPHRMEIVELLAQGPCPVDCIAECTGLSVANASQHLQTLKSARLVTTEKRGKYSYYSLPDSQVFEVWNALRSLGFSRNAQIGKLLEDFRKSRHNLESVTTTELLERIQQGNTLLLDVRPQGEYESGHIASAISIPQSELIHKLEQLPRNKEIVAYCRGPLCAMADDAVSLLISKGFQAVRLETGFPEWESNGLPVEHQSNVLSTDQ